MPISAGARAALYGQETDEAFPILLTIDHPDLAEPIRVCSDGVDLVSRGDTYVAYPFDIRLPDLDPDKPPKVTIQIDNVAPKVEEGEEQSPSIIATIRSLVGPPTVTMEVVMASTPDVVEAGPFEMTLRASPYDALTIEGELAHEDILNEPYPGDSFTPALFPGLF